MQVVKSNGKTQLDEDSLTEEDLRSIAGFVVRRAFNIGEPAGPLVVFLHGLLVAVETLSFATTAGISILDGATRTQQKELIQVSGCQPWIFAIIADIHKLRAWKREAIDSHSLNVVQLAEKTSKIKAAIDYGRAKSATDMGLECSLEVSQITEVYAHSAEIYLHVTASGAQAEIVEICSSVSEVVSTIRRISDSRQLRHLAWPVCVAASVAGREHDSFFEALSNGIGGDADQYPSLSRAFEVARECQRLRRGVECRNWGTETRAYDWYDAMRSLGKEWISF